MRLPKLHLDTDLGTNIDDLCALAMVLRWADAELLAVTTNLEQDGRRAGCVRCALDLAGVGTARIDKCRDVACNVSTPTPQLSPRSAPQPTPRTARASPIPVAAGAEATAPQRSRVPLPDEAAYWPEAILPAPGPIEDALSLLARSVEQGAAIVAIGATTNLALLETRHPGILSRAELYLMGGYVHPPRAGYPAMTNEMDTNIQVDVEAAEIVFRAANPTLIPLSVGVETSLRRAYLPALREAGPLGRLIARQAEVFAGETGKEARYGRACAGLPDDTINFQHDPLACAIALGWREGVEITEVPLVAEIRDGRLVERVNRGGQPTRVVTRVDGARFSEFWLDVVTDPVSI